MFDVAPSELLLVAIVALLFIGPKDLPKALRTLGRWVGQARRMSNHFKAGVEAMIREAEMEEIEREWRERNARIMAEHPDAEALDSAADESVPGVGDTPQMEPLDKLDTPSAAADSRAIEAQGDRTTGDDATESPKSPLSGPDGKPS